MSDLARIFHFISCQSFVLSYRVCILICVNVTYVLSYTPRFSQINDSQKLRGILIDVCCERRKWNKVDIRGVAVASGVDIVL